MSDEREKALVDELRDRCFVPVCRGVSAMKIEARPLIKQTAKKMEVWDWLSTHLQDAWTLSQKDNQEVRAGIAAESPFHFIGFCDSAWLVLCATYKGGILLSTKAVLVISQEQSDHERGGDVAEMMCKGLLLGFEV